MAINKVDFGGRTLIDLTGDTLTDAAQLLNGITAHSRDGSQITGTFRSQTKTATPSTSTQSITPSAGRWLSQVTVNPIPSNFIDLNNVLIHIMSGSTKYNEGSFPGGGENIADVSVTVGFRPKIIIVRNVDAVYSNSSSAPYVINVGVSVYDDDGNALETRVGFILYGNSNNRARGGQSNTNYFAPTANGFVGVGSSTKMYNGNYFYYAWG